MGRSGGDLISRKWEAVAHPTWKTVKRESKMRATGNAGISCTLTSVKMPNSLGLQVSNK